MSTADSPLCEDESDLEVVRVNLLKRIARELLTRLKNNMTVHWGRWEAARADMRVLLVQIRKHGCPQNIRKEAVQTVLPHAGVLPASGRSPE